jgi:hypothetical protein
MNLLAESVNLSAWQTLYEIVGSSGGALVGLQFVGIALIATTRLRPDFRAINAFGTPNVVHFSGALTISVIMCAPWTSTTALSTTLALIGVLGAIYAVVTFCRNIRETEYKPVFEDWLCYAILPCGIYATLTVAALVLEMTGRHGLFLIAGSALGLLLIGVRNAWDMVTHIVVNGQQTQEKPPH